MEFALTTRLQFYKVSVIAARAKTSVCFYWDLGCRKRKRKRPDTAMSVEMGLPAYEEMTPGIFGV